MNTMNASWMNEKASYDSIPTANAVSAAASPTSSQPRSESSSRDSRESLRIERTNSQSQANIPSKPISSSVPSHSSSSTAAFDPGPAVIRVP